MDQTLPDDPQKLLDEMSRVRETVRAEAAELSLCGDDRARRSGRRGRL
jgi:hypothetical protein